MPDSDSDYIFRLATPDDCPAIMTMMEQAKAQMYREGKRQWDESYPAFHHIQDDVARGCGYVLATGEGVAAYGALVYDGEPAYDNLRGEWLSVQPYLVVHRLAVADRYKRRGVATRFMQEAAGQARSRGLHSFKVDTNHDNFYMQRILGKLNFSYCGTVQYPRGERMAYEKLI